LEFVFFHKVILPKFQTPLLIYFYFLTTTEMNIEDLVRWGDKILIKYENLQKNIKKTDDEIKLEGRKL